MTTPQSILYELHYKIGAISRLIDGDEENDGIFERISQVELQNDDIINSLQRLENQLSLIIQVLAKSNVQ